MSKIKTVKAPTLKASSEVIGGHLSDVSKMPGLSWNLIAIKACPTGAKMAEIEGSACSGCYADGRGNYGFPNVQVALEKHLSTLESALETAETQDRWIQAMVHLIGHYQPAGEDRFRIHDSGDFINVEYYLMWCEVARRLPHLRFWAPTREVKIAKLAVMTAPANLRVRYSINMMDHYPQVTAEIPYVSYIQNKVKAPAGIPVCPAPKQGNKCRACDTCWSDAPSVAYHKH
jgi:hypothetical protein